MKKEKISKVSLGDIAKAAGVSKVAVCYALRNQPGVSRVTRSRIVRLAKTLGYAPDPRIASWMQRMRETKTKELLPIAWLNSTPERDAWNKINYLSPFLEGARQRALELGYRVDEIWARQPGMTMRRISQILSQRGIGGVIVSQPARHIRLDWTHLAGVSIDGSLLAPGLHRVMSDHAFNLLLALKSLKRLGYRRIGICLSEQVDRFSHHSFRATAFYFLSTMAKTDQVSPLFYSGEAATAQERILTWVRTTQPEVIVCLDNRLVLWLERAGYSVPRQLGVVHLAIDDDVSDWTGIHANKREIGAAAVEWVISLLQNHRFGLPATAMNMLIRGSWRSGRTLPRPRGRLLNVK